MKLKAAYVDYQWDSFGPSKHCLSQLIMGGVILEVGKALNKIDNLDSLPVLLYHPGFGNQDEIRRLKEDHPTLSIAIITNASNMENYNKTTKHPVFDYFDLGSITKFIKTHQAQQSNQ